MTKVGTETPIRVTTRIALASSPRAADRGVDPGGDAEHERDRERGETELDGRRQARQDHLADRLAGAVGVAEVALQEIADEAPVLHEQAGRRARGSRASRA